MDQPLSAHVRAALDEIERAEAALRTDVRPERSAILHALVHASVELGRVLAILGEGRRG